MGIQLLTSDDLGGQSVRGHLERPLILDGRITNCCMERPLLSRGSICGLLDSSSAMLVMTLTVEESIAAWRAISFPLQ